jgi:hypothetical protein
MQSFARQSQQRRETHQIADDDDVSCFCWIIECHEAGDAASDLEQCEDEDDSLTGRGRVPSLLDAQKRREHHRRQGGAGTGDCVPRVGRRGHLVICDG